MVGASARVKGLRVVIIEDNSTKAAALSTALSDLGAVVTVGNREDQGYEAVCNALPDAIVADLTAPGQPGWQLHQRVRRHPVLRFTPVLLFRWWEPSAEDRGIVRLTRVLDRLEEMLAPLRVLEDRLASSKPSSERLELTGPGPLLRLIAKARLSGLLTVNDAWSVFEVHIDHGDLHSIVRRGLGGSIDSGEVAFQQLMLCEAGRWSWRKLPRMEVSANLKRGFEKAVAETSALLGAIFSPGPHKVIRDPRHLTVQADLLADLSATMPLSVQRASEAMLAGLPRDNIENLFSVDDPQDIERSLHTLVRCGAIRIHRLPRMSEVGSTQRLAAETAMALLEMAQRDAALRPSDESGVIITDSIPPLPASDERFFGVARPRSLRRRETESLPSLDFSDSSLKLEPSEIGGDAADAVGRSTLPESVLSPLPNPSSSALESRSSSRMSSVGPSEMPEKSGAPVQMWIGLGLALLMGLALIAGLLVIAGGGKRESQDRGDTASESAPSVLPD
jgi:hypothetical protein